uniref:Uncharacterized protein n=1 Tax=Lepeophtheirus salmonis TaxID=72036 RepID=A0A0K2VCR9_LEPSM
MSKENMVPQITKTMKSPTKPRMYFSRRGLWQILLILYKSRLVATELLDQEHLDPSKPRSEYTGVLHLLNN